MPSGSPVLLQDRPSAGRPQRDITAADEAMRSVVEVVAVEFVDRLAERAGAHERVHDFVEEHIDRRRDLVGIVAAGHAVVCLRIVWLCRCPESSNRCDVVLGERTQDDEVRRLLEFAALHVDIGHAGGTLAGRIEIDAGNVAERCDKRSCSFLSSAGRIVVCGRRLRIVAAGEPFAEAAVRALAHLHAVGVLVRAATYSRPRTETA